MPSTNLPLPILQAIRRGQGKQVTADAAYDIALNAHEVLPEWPFIEAYRHQEAFMRRKK